MPEPDLKSPFLVLGVRRVGETETETEAFLKCELVSCEKAHGPEHQNVAVALLNLASFYFKAHSNEKAERLFLRSVEITERLFGPESPHLAPPLDYLASLYELRQQSQLEEGIRRRLLAIYRRAIAADHPNIANILLRLVALCRAQKKWRDARTLYDDSLQMFERAIWSSSKSLQDELAAWKATLGLMINSGYNTIFIQAVMVLSVKYEEAGRTSDAVVLSRLAAKVREDDLKRQRKGLLNAIFGIPGDDAAGDRSPGL